MTLWQKVAIGLVLGILLGMALTHFPQGLDIVYLVGNMFMRSLRMMMGPLIFCTLVKGIVSSSSAASLGRIGFKIILVSLITTAFAVVFGIGVGHLINPGRGVPPQIDSEPFSEVQSLGFRTFILNIVPENVIEAFSQGNLLQIVFFSIFTGIVISQFKHRSDNMEKVISFMSKMVFEMITIIVKFSPYGVCALMAFTIATQGFSVILSMAKLIGAMLFAIILQYLVYGVLIIAFCRKSPFPFYRKSLTYQLMAFSTSSTKAALPTTMKICTDELGISESSTSFMIPISAAVNMNGSAIGLGLSTMFFAQMYSVTLGWNDYLAVILTSTIGAIGAAGVPGASIIMLPIVLQSVGIPTGSVAILASIDRILDMMRTTVNVTGDVAMTMIVDNSEGTWDKEKYSS
jgi:Na+/H+-dicarboxylate symporter